MNELRTTDEKTFKFRDLSAEFDGQWLKIDDAQDNVVFDLAEAIALKNWLNEVLK